jgi:hypothetical protein
VTGSGRLGANIRQEMLELLDAYQSAEARYRLAVDPNREGLVEQAQALLSSMRDTLGWYFLDVGDETGQARLDKLARVHEGAYSHDALAAALYNYAALAEMYLEQITGLVGFDRSVIEQAAQTALELRERSAGPASADPHADPARLLDLRLRIATLLYDRMQTVRSAARVVFKGKSSLLQQVTSDYNRLRRAEYRRRQDEGTAFETADTAPMPIVKEEDPQAA